MKDVNQSSRTVLDLSKGWEFDRRKAGRRWLSGEGWVAGTVNVPHCWNGDDTFLEGVSYYRGWGSYRRQFHLPPAGQASPVGAWVLRVGGFYGTGDLWLNGRKVCEVVGQYLGFEVDLSAWLQDAAPNTVALRLTNRCRSYVLPGIDDPDFILFGGLAGTVTLEGVPPVSLDRATMRVRVEGACSEQPVVGAEGVLRNTGANPAVARLTWRVLDASANEVARADGGEFRVEPGESLRLPETRLPVSGIRLWSLDHPHLYHVEGCVDVEGCVQDSLSTRFGFREAEFRPGQGFFLNGGHVFLRGVNRHEWMPGCGNAMSAEMHHRDAVLMKDLGLNFVRLSHYPQSPDFLDACDEQGILVYAEIASWKSVRTGRWLRNACRQMEQMILRDRNHPSVILWGMGNESRSRRAYEDLQAVVRRLDPSRPTIYAENHLYRARREKTLGLPDVWGCNYELDCLAEGAAASRLACVLVSECSNYPPAVRGDAEAEAAQVDLIRKDLARLRDKPYVAGFALWCWVDYPTMRKKRYRRHCGLMDAWRVPKRAAEWLKLGGDHA